MNQSDPEASIRAAYIDAKARGLPDCWRCSIDKRNRRKWTAPTGRSCDSIPKALAISVELGLLPADFPIQAGPNKRKRSSGGGPKPKQQAPHVALSSDDGGGEADEYAPPPTAKRRTSSTAAVEPVLAAEKAKSLKQPNDLVAESSSKKPTKPEVPVKALLSSSSSEEEEDDHSFNEAPPEPMNPEISLDGLRRSAAPTTVHWDPSSANGKLIGMSVRVAAPAGSPFGDWLDGRVILYDPFTHKHKIQWEIPTSGDGSDGGSPATAVDTKVLKKIKKSESTSWIWLRNEEHNLYIATELVWAHVKGYAWWPALVREANTEDTGIPASATPAMGNRSVKVEFFGTGEVATLRDTPESLRPFHPLEALDPVVAKHKKKRNAKATALATTEWYSIRHARNQAAIWFARKAWNMANIVSGQVPYIGKQVQIFRDDINYPYGDTLTGKVHAYSHHQRKWLCSYEISDKNAKYEASWINLQNKQVSTRLLSRKAAKQNQPLEDLTAQDLLPFLYGFELIDPGKSDMNLDFVDSQELKLQEELSELWQERCHACVEPLKKDQPVFKCSVCNSSHHLGCLDPPLTVQSFNRLLREGKPLVCSRCVPCRGCYQRDIVFGTHQYSPSPPSLSFPEGESLDLCSMCKEAYDRKQFCPNCAHSWDDVKFQKVRRQIENLGRNNNSGPGRKRKLPTDRITLEDSSSLSLTGRFSVDTCIPVGAKIDPSWYAPETVEWGFTEIEMLVCDSCKVWVHAGCVPLSEEEYNETSEGNHEIFSKEFLCRVCCKRRCTELVLALQHEDRMSLFAVPVTEDAAPNYRDVIKEPMDLQTMLQRAENDNHQHYAWVRESFELMVLNALTFNNFNTRVWSEAKRYYNACLENVFAVIGKAAPASKYENDVMKIFEKAEEAKKKEEDRNQVDETVEKKDLVAGSLAPTIKLPCLQESPPDQPSCVPHTEVQLKPVDAFFWSWKDSCFTCGSSGSQETMLFCVDCGEAYHSFCVNAPIHSMSESAALGWRCPNCKVCEISGDVPQDETSLVYCEMCDRAYSLHLLDPPLEKAPPGLFICGQCVDCKVCTNTADPRGASLKHWSRDPEKCFSCGGCEGLISSEGALSCNVCRKLLRGDEPNLVSCIGCGSYVHSSCDPRAERHVKALEPVPRALKAQKIKPPDTYLCPTCYQPAADNIPERTAVDRKDAYRLAWKAVKNNELPTLESQSQVDMYRMLTDRIEWAIRDRWRHEYMALIEDGMKFYVKAKNEEGDPSSIVQLVFNRLVNLPLWKAQRALRFVAMARRAKWESRIDLDSIHRIVIGAKLAASYIDVACHVMQLNIEDHVRFAGRMEELLEAPNEVGMFTLMNDDFEQDVKTSDLDLCDVDMSKTSSDVGSSRGNRHNRYEDDLVEVTVPKPLAGWDNDVDIGQTSEWADSRECCLCHLCGDDDAVLPHPDARVEDYSRWGLPVQLGRLLPMADGNWIHTSCALWSSEVYEDANDGLIHAVEKARARGAQLKCFGCGRYGATVGCNKSNCSFNYHYACAKVCDAVFTCDQHVFCVNHRSKSIEPLKKESFDKPLIIAQDKKSTLLEKEASDLSVEDLCVRVGGLVVHSLGKIDQSKEGYFSQDHVFPLGYFATRIFWSSVEPRKRTVYILQVSEGDVDGRVEFSITPADNTSGKIRGHSMSTVYSSLLERVRKVNSRYYSHGDLFSTLPMARRSRRKTFGLNGPQFFGFGLSCIRKRLERLPGIEAVVCSKSAPPYRFCFVQPDVEAIRDLQRRRAARKSELSLVNSTGCARTEGFKPVDTTGRITRALVRSAEELGSEATSESTLTKLSDRNVYQMKYRAMKAVPLDQRLVARRSHIHGYGLFTKIDIPRNDPIVEYVGEVIQKRIADIREKQYEISGEGSCYMFRLDLHRIVDATMIGSMARFMNHSCSANAYAKIISVDTEFGQDKKIVVFANRDINAGEEITYDYKFPVEDGSLKCMCGAPNCIGRLN